MENVSDIHFSKCDCPDGYDGDPYNFSQWCLISVLQNVIVRTAAMVILTIFPNDVWYPIFKMRLSRRLRWWSLRFFTKSWSWKMCLLSIFQNVIVPGAMRVILTIFHNVPGSWRMCLKSIFENVTVPAATMAILTLRFFSIIKRCLSMCLKSIFSKCECP